MFADKEKCKRCGACAAECPYDLIVEDLDGFPKLRLAAKKTCIACGHCVAVCPTSALTLPDMPAVTPELTPQQCSDVTRKLKVSPEQADQFPAQPTIHTHLQGQAGARGNPGGTP